MRQLWLFIDAAAGTVITAYDGDAREIEHLKCDVTNLAHYLRPDAEVLVIGAGGGRDVLSALAFGQRSVVGVELNENILETVNGRFGQFAGHLDRDPRVTFVNDEARSWLARQTDRFDIVQASLVDTWAATAAGAYVLSEHTLYTVEAWKTFLDHLSARGLLTVSHFWHPERRERFYRFVSLAAESLAAIGVTDPRPHILIARTHHRAVRNVATILVSREPFAGADVDAFEEVVRRLDFRIVLTPRTAEDSNLERLASSSDRESFVAEFRHNVAAPTDDSPFFFHTGRMGAAVRGLLSSNETTQRGPVFVLVALSVTVVVLTLGFIILPLAVATRSGTLTGAAPLLLFFASIGLGFMLIEVSQLQRLTVFLGHPIYGLVVVLFTLLTASGLGSYLTDPIDLRVGTRPAVMRLVLLLAAALAFGLLTPTAIDVFSESITPVRIGVAAGMLGVLGVPMGMCFPLGMKLASETSEALTPWLWGINGATSVCASVFAVVIATSAGIAAAFWTGVGCYAIAALAFVWAARTDY